jgi:hypothetical protein
MALACKIYAAPSGVITAVLDQAMQGKTIAIIKTMINHIIAGVKKYPLA